jgi:hypothetical protein
VARFTNGNVRDENQTPLFRVRIYLTYLLIAGYAWSVWQCDPWKQDTGSATQAPSVEQARWSICRQYLASTTYPDIERGAFAKIQQYNLRVSTLIIRKVRTRIVAFDFNPRSLIKREVMVRVVPLKVSYNRVSNADNSNTGLEDTLPYSPRFPPWYGILLGIAGLGGIGWGWWHIKDERSLPWSGISFFLGCVLWGWCLLIILPWSVG